MPLENDFHILLLSCNRLFCLEENYSYVVVKDIDYVENGLIDYYDGSFLQLKKEDLFLCLEKINDDEWKVLMNNKLYIATKHNLPYLKRINIDEQ